MDLDVILISGILILIVFLVGFLFFVSLMFIIKRLSIFNPKNHQKELASFNKNSPTLRFMIAINSINNRSDKPFHLGTGSAPKDMQVFLKDYWGIETREDLIDSINKRLSFTNYSSCKSYIDTYIIHKAPSKGIVSKSLFKVLNSVHETFPELGILGFDLCQATNLASWGLSAGYLNHEECLNICLETASLIQKNFHSWDELMESSLLGMQFSNAAFGSNFDTSVRRLHYNQCKENTIIYSVPWDTALVLDNEVISLSAKCMQYLNGSFRLSIDLATKILVGICVIFLILVRIFNW